MIFDHIDNISKYKGIHSRLDEAIDYLEKTDFNSVSFEKMLVNEEHVYCKIEEYKTQPKELRAWESHKKYIDIQYVFNGSEKMGIQDVRNLEIDVPYSETTDFMFYLDNNEGNYIIVPQKHFVVFFQEDAHMPSLHPHGEESTVKKIVMKVEV